MKEGDNDKNVRYSEMTGAAEHRARSVFDKFW
jgi:hypothetical protein